MDFIFHRSYRGPLKAAILDWAGTILLSNTDVWLPPDSVRSMPAWRAEQP